MAPNPEWDDFALTRQFAALDKRMEMHDHTLDGLSHFPVDVAKAALQIEQLAREVAEVRQGIRDVAETCKDIRKDWREADASRQKGRVLVIVAIISGCCTVLASIALAVLG